MKKNIIIISYFFGFISCLIVTTVSAAILYNAKDIEFNPSDESWNVNNMQDAVNDIKDNYIPKSELLGKAWEFDYTGGEQTFNIPIKGTYKIELWGAQGGQYNTTYHGGYGAYTIGNIKYDSNQKIFINVGGAPEFSSIVAEEKKGGYNGGGASTYRNDCVNNAGGGATSVAYVSGELLKLSNQRDSVTMVAAGGGGAGYYSSTRYGIGGSGGGIEGNAGEYGSASNCEGFGYGGTQNSGGSLYLLAGHAYASSYNVPEAGFGFGSSGDVKIGGSGGGSGWFGGRGTSCLGGGGGGSSYIGNKDLTNKAMYCNNCKTSDKEDTKTISNTCVSEDPVEQCSKKGHGYAKITLISID